jgi:hypothetical protein
MVKAGAAVLIGIAPGIDRLVFDVGTAPGVLRFRRRFEERGKSLFGGRKGTVVDLVAIERSFERLVDEDFCDLVGRKVTCGQLTKSESHDDKDETSAGETDPLPQPF